MDSRTSSLKQSTKTPGIRWLSKNYGPNDVLSEGYLTKIGQRWKSHKRRWFVITFQDIRYYENRVRPSCDSTLYALKSPFFWFLSFEARTPFSHPLSGPQPIHSSSLMAY